MAIRSLLHRVLALAFVHLLTCAIPVGPASAADAESSIDRPGNDYRNFDLSPSIAGFAPCQSFCESDGQCKAWTFVKSGVQGPKARCWLKNAVADAVPNNCCVSGVKSEKPIKSTGRGGSATNPDTSSLGPQVLAYAQRQLGQCVDGNGRTRAACQPLAMGQVGDGECTHLVQAALASVGARFTPSSYLWGTKVNAPYQPGDIIQLFNAKLVGPNGWWETGTQHSAIIESVNGGVLGVIEQNTWVDNTNRRYVTRGTINLNWKLERGYYIVYRATAGEPAGGSGPKLPGGVLSCRGGGGMNVTERNGGALVDFTPAAQPANTALPGPGECAWPDRLFAANEPHRLAFTADKPNAQLLIAAARGGGTFQVTATPVGGFINVHVINGVQGAGAGGDNNAGGGNGGGGGASAATGTTIYDQPEGNDVAYLSAGDPVTIVNCDNNNWCRISTPRKGWVWGGDLDK